MNAETIKSFLISPGLSIDDEGMQIFASMLLRASQIILALDRAADSFTRSAVALTPEDGDSVEAHFVSPGQTDVPVLPFPVQRVGRLGQCVVQRYPAIEQDMAKVLRNLAQTVAHDNLHLQASAGALVAGSLNPAIRSATWAPLAGNAQRAMQWVEHALLGSTDGVNATLSGPDEPQNLRTVLPPVRGKSDVTASGERFTIRNITPRAIRPTEPSAQAEATQPGWMQAPLARLEQLYWLPEDALRQVSTAMLFDIPDDPTDTGTSVDVKSDTTRSARQTAKNGSEPLKSLRVATRYIDTCIDTLLGGSGDGVNHALVSYNLGMGAVGRYGMTLLSDNARDYVPRQDGRMSVAGPTLNQQTTVNVYGVSSPQEAADTVVGKQQSIMSNSIQQLITGPR